MCSLCHPTDCSLPGSSVHEIFQARVLEWVATVKSQYPDSQKSENTTLKTVSWQSSIFCLCNSFKNPRFLSYLQLYNCRLYNSHSLEIDHLIESGLYVSLSLLYSTHREVLCVLERLTQISSSPPPELLLGVLMVPPLISQMGYVHSSTGPFLIEVYLILQLPALSLPLDYKTLKIKGNLIFSLHPLYLQL